MVESPLMSRLRSLNLGYNEASNDNTKALACREDLEPLEEVLLEFCTRVYDDSIATLVDNNTLRIKSLNLAGTGITVYMPQSIAASETMTWLERLNVTSCEFDDVEAHYRRALWPITTSPVMVNLQSVEVLCAIDNETIEALLALPSFDRI